MRIKYFGYYDTVESLHKRMFVTSATNKMDYIIQALNSIGIGVDIISCSYSLDKHFSIISSEKKEININSITLFSSISGNNLLVKLVRHIWHLLTLFYYLRIEVKKNETISV